jgi:hypothetical protein
MSDTIDGSGNDYGRGAIIIIVMMTTVAQWQWSMVMVIDMNVIVD